jgi:DMSO/TMAO reductase YedYZ molybdopterin-dependent catalytic subunit
VSPVKGSQWSYGDGNVRFKGVSLKSVFEKFDVRPHALARFITAEGRGSARKAGSGRLRAQLAARRNAVPSDPGVRTNGQPLPAVHGGPLRLVTPGYYGTMHVKWLSRLRLETQESVNHHQSKRYRTPRELIQPGGTFDYRVDNSDAHWRMKIKSVFFAPVQNAAAKGPKVLASGVAWNDGTALIDAVELSSDGGQTWRLRRTSASRPLRVAALASRGSRCPPRSHTLICCRCRHAWQLPTTRRRRRLEPRWLRLERRRPRDDSRRSLIESLRAKRASRLRRASCRAAACRFAFRHAASSHAASSHAASSHAASSRAAAASSRACVVARRVEFQFHRDGERFAWRQDAQARVHAAGLKQDGAGHAGQRLDANRLAVRRRIHDALAESRRGPAPSGECRSRGRRSMRPSIRR